MFRWGIVVSTVRAAHVRCACVWCHTFIRIMTHVSWGALAAKSAFAQHASNSQIWTCNRCVCNVFLYVSNWSWPIFPIDAQRSSLFLLSLRYWFVMIISSKKFLNTWSLQLCLVLLHLLSICVFPLAVRVFGIKVIFSQGWDKGRRNLFVVKFVPIDITEPRVLFYFLWTV